MFKEKVKIEGKSGSAIPTGSSLILPEPPYRTLGTEEVRPAVARNEDDLTFSLLYDR